MSETINATAGFSSSLTVPSNGDINDAGSVKTPFQSLLNSAKYLYDLVVTSGVLAIRTVADIAALKALTGMANGQVAYVRGRGIYLYADPDATAAAEPWIVVPTVGTGRWRHEHEALRDTASGFPTLDGAGRLTSPGVVTNRIVATYGVALSADQSSSSNTFTDVPGFSVSVPNCAVGDIVDMAAFVSTEAASSTVVSVQAVITDAGAAQTKTIAPYLANGGFARPTLIARATIGTAGTATAKVQLQADGSHAAIVHGAISGTPVSNLRVLHLRP